MRNTTPLQWIEEAEARRVVVTAVSEKSAPPVRFVLARKMLSPLSPLLGRVRWRPTPEASATID